MYKRPEPCPQAIEDNPHLAPWTMYPKSSDAALAAKNLRRDLRKQFPKLKFSIKSENYSGGSSVRASIELYEVDGWDPAKANKINNLAKKTACRYQYGSFDGMTDSYDYNSDADSRNFTNTFGGAKYVFIDVGLKYAPTDPKEIKKRLDRISKENERKERAEQRKVKM